MGETSSSRTPRITSHADPQNLILSRSGRMGRHIFHAQVELDRPPKNMAPSQSKLRVVAENSECHGLRCCETPIDMESRVSVRQKSSRMLGFCQLDRLQANLNRGLSGRDADTNE